MSGCACRWRSTLLLVVASALVSFSRAEDGTIKFKDGNGKQASPDDVNVPPLHDCEVCFILAEELVLALEETAKVKEVLQMGNRLDAKGNWVTGKRVLFANSEARLLEAMEDICDATEEWRPEHDDEGRYWLKDELTMDSPKMKSMAMMNGLAPGLADQILPKMADPFGEKPKIKQACYAMVEEYETSIYRWFNRKQREFTLRDYLCNEVIAGGECDDFSQWFFTGEEEDGEGEEGEATEEEEGEEVTADGHDEL